MSKLLQINKPTCRGDKFHYNPHSSLKDSFCKKCNAYVKEIKQEKCKKCDSLLLDKICNKCNALREKKDEVKKLTICECCGSKIETQENPLWIQRILNAGIRQHRNYVRDWAMFPTKEKVWLEIRHNSAVYEIQIKYLALYFESTDSEMNDKKMTLIRKKLTLKGINFLEPSDEDLIEKCYICREKLHVTRNGALYCKACLKGKPDDL